MGTLFRHPLWHLMAILILAGGMIPLVATWSFFRTARDLETLGGNWEIVLGPGLWRSPELTRVYSPESTHPLTV